MTAEAGPRILVLLRRLDRDPRHVDEDEVMGRCERAALAATLYLRAATGGVATAVAMGGARREDRVLAMALRAGCDHAIRITDSEIDELDYLGVADVLGACARHADAELVVCGARSQDEHQGATGPALAHQLGLPHLSSLVDVEVDDGTIIASRRAEGEIHRLRVPLPAVLCVSSFPASRRATDGDSPSRSGAIDTLNLSSLELDARTLAHRRRFLGPARAARSGPNATMLASASELYARLAADGIVE